MLAYLPINVSWKGRTLTGKGWTLFSKKVTECLERGPQPRGGQTLNHNRKKETKRHSQTQGKVLKSEIVIVFFPLKQENLQRGRRSKSMQDQRHEQFHKIIYLFIPYSLSHWKIQGIQSIWDRKWVRQEKGCGLKRVDSGAEPEQGTDTGSEMGEGASGARREVSRSPV